MSNKRRSYTAQARFIEIGSPGAPFRSLVNVDHVTNVRFEQKVDTIEPEFDDDGNMTKPPQHHVQGWQITLALAHGAGVQNIFIPNEDGAVALYNQILDMINGTGAPISRLPKLTVQETPSPIIGANGQPVANDELPGESELSDDELDQLEHPEIDVDAIADAVEQGVKDEPN